MSRGKFYLWYNPYSCQMSKYLHMKPGKKPFQRSAEISVVCSGHYEDWCRKQSRNSLRIHDRDFDFSSAWVLLNKHGFHNWSSYMQWRNCLYSVTPKNKFSRWCNHIHVISEEHDWIYPQHLSSFPCSAFPPLVVGGQLIPQYFQTWVYFLMTTNSLVSKAQHLLYLDTKDSHIYWAQDDGSAQSLLLALTNFISI